MEPDDQDLQPVLVPGTYEWALWMIKQGWRVQRRGWNGKGMFVFLGGGYTVPVDEARDGGVINREFLKSRGVTELKILPHIDMWSAQNEYVTGWLASQTDMLADDWEQYFDEQG